MTIMIEKIGNLKKDLEKQFNSYFKNGNENSKWNYRDITRKNIINEDSVLFLLKKNFDIKCESSASFFNNYDSSCDKWHYDAWNTSHMVFVAFPTPTEIVNFDNDNFKFNSCDNDYASLNDKNFLKKEVLKDTKRVESKVGDVFVVSMNVIHRTPPDQVGKPRLLVRIPFNMV